MTRPEPHFDSTIPALRMPPDVPRPVGDNDDDRYDEFEMARDVAGASVLGGWIVLGGTILALALGIIAGAMVGGLR